MTAAWLSGAAARASAQSIPEPEPAVAPSVAEGEARIQPGDQIAVRIFREPELSGSYTVAENGDVVLPRVGTIPASEFSPRALQDSLRTVYAQYLRDPLIEVTVLRRIAVHGEVRRPDIYMVDLTMTLREVIARAGGITEAGNPNRITIVRDGEPLRLGDGDAVRFGTAQLRSGDQIFVGRRSWVALNPFVAISTATGLVTFFLGLVQLARR